MNPEIVTFILTNRCISNCDHCEIFSSPFNNSVISTSLISKYLRKIKTQKSIKKIIFSGGEPFLYFSKIRKSIHEASTLGFHTGIWSSGYWQNSKEEFSLSISSLAQVGLNELFLSIDELHKNKKLKDLLPSYKEICNVLNVKLTIVELKAKNNDEPPIFANNGAPILSGNIKFNGRASEKLLENQSLWNPDDFDICPHESFLNPHRIWLDFLGNIHLCPGITIGNLNKLKLSELLKIVDLKNHPILTPLIQGGPVKLANVYDIKVDKGYVDHCHFCFTIRKQLIKRFPPVLTPLSFYGI
jgi:organic radical activating enzyme